MRATGSVMVLSASRRARATGASDISNRAQWSGTLRAKWPGLATSGSFTGGISSPLVGRAGREVGRETVIGVGKCADDLVDRVDDLLAVGLDLVLSGAPARIEVLRGSRHERVGSPERAGQVQPGRVCAPEQVQHLLHVV